MTMASRVVVSATRAIIAVAAIGILSAASALAADAKPATAAAKITYAEHVRPIFREHCFNCHNQNKATNDLALDTYERIRKGGASGEAIQPGDPANSNLFLLVTHASEPHMPPNQDKIAAAKIEILKQWIQGGALKDSGSSGEAAKKPAMSLSVVAGAAKPKGPAIMPEGLPTTPVVATPRAAAITAIASSPWAPVVAVAGQKQIALYHAETAQLLGILPFAEGIPYVLKFSRSGALLLAAGGQNVRRGVAVVYDVRTGKRLFEVGDELDVALAADISPDHSRVALGGPEKIVRVFSSSGTQLYEIRKHNDWIYAVEFSPDGVLLATADRGGGLVVWEAETGREFQNLEGHKGPVTGVSFRPDSNALVSGSEDGTIKLWGMEDGRLLKSWNAHGEGGVTWLECGRDARIVSSGRDRLVKLWNPDGAAVRSFEPMKELVTRTVFTHDGSRVVAGDWSGEVRVWKTADGKPAGTLKAIPGR
jgi:hypothetical protein